MLKAKIQKFLGFWLFLVRQKRNGIRSKTASTKIQKKIGTKDKMTKKGEKGK